MGEPATFVPEVDFEEASMRVVEKDKEWKVRHRWWFCRDITTDLKLGDDRLQLFNTKFDLWTGTLKPFFMSKDFAKLYDCKYCKHLTATFRPLVLR